MGKKSRRSKKKKGQPGGDGKTSSQEAPGRVINSIDQQCDERIAALTSAQKDNAKKTLRFKVGDRVKCKMHSQSDDDLDMDAIASLSISDMLSQALSQTGPFEMSWKHGTVVQLWYISPLKKDDVHPYQIRLDEVGTLIYAPNDRETCVQKSDIPLPAADPRDVALFAQPPIREDCPLCFLPLPLLQTRQTKYYSCCGKVVCLGCIISASEAEIDRFCPFCRAPAEDVHEGIMGARMQKRIQANDPDALYALGLNYYKGADGMPHDKKRAIELTTKAAELGLPSAHFSLGVSYERGDGVEPNAAKARFHFQEAALAGHGGGRHSLGCMEHNLGNASRSMSHFMVAARAGYDYSLKIVKQEFLDGNVTKDDFEQTVRAHKESLDEIRSESRDKAAARYPYNPHRE